MTSDFFRLCFAFYLNAFLFCMHSVLPSRMSVPNVFTASGIRKRTLEPLELELRTVVSGDDGSGN